jgi:D-threo-aldose 1-dehydrogenase
LNHFLRGKPRDSYLLSTKVGRYLKVCAPGARSLRDTFYETPARQEVFDYTYDGVMRSLEFSYERLGVDRFDIVFCHDIDMWTHKSRPVVDTHIRTFLDSGAKALYELRDAGVIGAIGAGVNEWDICEELARKGDFDLFLLAGRYTLLEQEALESFLPLCIQNQIGIVIGGPYNSGILATGARPNAFYNYAPAPQAVLDRVARLERICAAHGVPLPAAALRFPLFHPAVVSVVPGGQVEAEVRRNSETIRVAIPAELWTDLKKAGLLREDAPIGN